MLVAEVGGAPCACLCALQGGRCAGWNGLHEDPPRQVGSPAGPGCTCRQETRQRVVSCPDGGAGRGPVLAYRVLKGARFGLSSHAVSMDVLEERFHVKRMCAYCCSVQDRPPEDKVRAKDRSAPGKSRTRYRSTYSQQFFRSCMDALSSTPSASRSPCRRRTTVPCWLLVSENMLCVYRSSFPTHT